MQAVRIVVLSVLACVLYGMIHDQITARICVEYFTVGHRRVIQSQDPTLLGIVWGVLATWWVGLFLGIPLAAFARLGPRPKRTAASLVRPIAVLMVVTAWAAVVIGLVTWLAASNGWMTLPSKWQAKLPAERHTLFLVAYWIHNGSYVSGFVGGLLVMAWVWRTRILKALAIDNHESHEYHEQRESCRVRAVGE